MTTSVFNDVLERYVRMNLVPQMKNSINRFMVGAALGAGRLRAEALRPQLEGLGIMEGDNVDTAKLAAALRGGFDQTPDVSIFGFRFSRDDADAFIRELNVAPSQQFGAPVPPPVQNP